MTTLLEAADELYAQALPDFTPARDALAKQLKARDKELSARVKALRKPSTAAWVVNLLARREAAQVDEVLRVGAALREAQASLDGDELRALTRQRRQLTAALTQQARALATEHGQRVTTAVAEQVEATLTAAMLDPGAGEAVRSGLLVAAVAATGVDQLDAATYVALPDAVGFVPSPVQEPHHAPPELHVVPDPDEEEKRLEAARATLAEADQDLAGARESWESANHEVGELEAHTLQLQSEIDELRRRLGELEVRADEVDEELDEARAVAASAHEDVQAAESARSRAAAIVARLTN